MCSVVKRFERRCLVQSTLLSRFWSFMTAGESMWERCWEDTCICLFYWNQWKFFCLDYLYCNYCLRSPDLTLLSHTIVHNGVLNIANLNSYCFRQCHGNSPPRSIQVVTSQKKLFLKSYRKDQLEWKNLVVPFKCTFNIPNHTSK